MVSFINAEGQRDNSELIPHGTLAWGVLSIRPANPDANVIPVQSRSSDAQYLDCEVTITGGDHDKRRVWTRIGVAGSQAYINMGRAAIKAILECSRGAHPETNPQGYEIGELDPGSQVETPNYMELDGAQVGVKVKVEKGQNGYQDKNDIGLWLSPLDTPKDFDRLCKGDTRPSADTKAPAARAGGQGAQQPAWATPQPQGGQQTQATQPAPQPAPQQRPAQPAPQQRPAQPASGGGAAPGKPAWLQGR